MKRIKMFEIFVVELVSIKFKIYFHSSFIAHSLTTNVTRSRDWQDRICEGAWTRLRTIGKDCL